MSLFRLAYYSMMVSGWAALAGWLISEQLVFRSRSTSPTLEVVLVMGIVGAAIGLAVNLVSGLVNGQWQRLALRALPGLVCGGLGGALGGLIGHGLYVLGLPRAVGWLIAGLGIGMVDGLYERSSSKIRNGLVGGGIGGLIGGILFDVVRQAIASPTGMSSRAVAFVVLGMCIGALVGLAQIVLKEAWLTVLDGYRAGRQLILSQRVTFLGRGDHLPLPFLGPMNKDVESEHLKITRQPNGQFVLEDNHSRLGTRLNSRPIQGPTPLADGNVIKFGTNFVRFNERQEGGSAGTGRFAPAFRGRSPPLRRLRGYADRRPDRQLRVGRLLCLPAGKTSSSPTARRRRTATSAPQAGQWIAGSGSNQRNCRLPVASCQRMTGKRRLTTDN